MGQINNILDKNNLLKGGEEIDELGQFKKLEQLCADLNFDVLQSQFNFSHKEAEFVHVTGKFLILSDRLDNIAIRMGSFIREKTSGHVLGTIASKDELEECMMNTDYLIIIGYLEDESNFEVVNKIRLKNNNIKIVFYATNSSTARKQIDKYEIDCLFERDQSLGKFLELF